jgi:hypothetical protein
MMGAIPPPVNVFAHCSENPATRPLQSELVRGARDADGGYSGYRP